MTSGGTSASSAEQDDPNCSGDDASILGTGSGPDQPATLGALVLPAATVTLQHVPQDFVRGECTLFARGNNTHEQVGRKQEVAHVLEQRAVRHLRKVGACVFKRLSVSLPAST